MENVKVSKQQNSRIKYGKKEDQPSEKLGTEYPKKPNNASASNNTAGSQARYRMFCQTSQKRWPPAIKL